MCKFFCTNFSRGCAAEQAYIDGTLAVYEFNQIDLLRDVFSWAYERSCQRYFAITQTMAEPGLLRIRYREALILIVQAIVQFSSVEADPGSAAPPHT
jgi:hypothetical protein